MSALIFLAVCPRSGSRSFFLAPLPFLRRPVTALELYWNRPFLFWPFRLFANCVQTAIDHDHSPPSNFKLLPHHHELGDYFQVATSARFCKRLSNQTSSMPGFGLDLVVFKSLQAFPGTVVAPSTCFTQYDLQS